MSYFSEDCPIQLLPHQIEHVRNMWHALFKDKIYGVVDTSIVGSGKTFAALYLAWHMQKKYDTKIFLIAPSDASLNNDDGWLSHAEEFGVKIEYATTYSSLRGGRGTVSHPWLIPDPEDKKNWVASSEFKSLCKKGVLLLMDESHHAKNLSMTHFACAALVKAAKKYRDVCRVLLCSHTPGDKDEHCVQLLRMAGIVTSTKMFQHVAFTSDFEIEGYGLGELIRVCKKISPRDSARIDDMMENMSKAKSLRITKELYREFIRQEITFAMPVPKNEYKVTLQNAFLETDAESLKLLEDGLAMLGGAVHWNGHGVDDNQQWNLGNVTTSLKMIEQGKLCSMAKYVNREAKKFKNKKFVISCGARDVQNHTILQQMIYRETKPEDYIPILKELKKKNKYWAQVPNDVINYHLFPVLCEKKRPHILNGETSKAERVNIIRKFQEDNNECWCLLISPGVGSESISLHDKIGGRPRDMLVTPDYYFTRVVQNAGRINRVGMKSDAKVMIVYSKEASIETSILQSMVMKSKTARDMIAEGQKVTYPGEYPYFIEGKQDRELEEYLEMLKEQVQ